MALTYKNRRGDKYYLHKRETKKGNMKYYFSKKRDNDVLNKIPAGYEIYENPNAQVFLRKKSTPVLSDEEIGIVEEAMKKLCKLEKWKINVRKNVIEIHEACEKAEALRRVIMMLSPSIKSGGIEKIIDQTLNYIPLMRFFLFDKKNRIFSVERIFFSGSCDEWLFLESSDNLKYLAEKYCPHVGQESLFEFNGIDEYEEGD